MRGVERGSLGETRVRETVIPTTDGDGSAATRRPPTELQTLDVPLAEGLGHIVNDPGEVLASMILEGRCRPLGGNAATCERPATVPARLRSRGISLR